MSRLSLETYRNGGGGVEDIRHSNVAGGSDDDDDDACLRCLSDGGNGFVVGVDRRGTIVATSTTTGEPRVLLLLTPDTARATAANFATMDYDHSSGIVALAMAGGVDRASAAATSVDLYEVRRGCD